MAELNYEKRLVQLRMLRRESWGIFFKILSTVGLFCWNDAPRSDSQELMPYLAL